MSLRTKARPKVRATEADFERLAAIGSACQTESPGGALLLQELERFAIVSDQSARTKFVRLGSKVTYRDRILGRDRTVRVGLPGEADVDENRISVLAPVGAALIGLAVGDVFRWEGPDEKPREIEVLSIEE